jgi:hypothetical protein
MRDLCSSWSNNQGNACAHGDVMLVMPHALTIKTKCLQNLGVWDYSVRERNTQTFLFFVDPCCSQEPHQACIASVPL